MYSIEGLREGIKNCRKNIDVLEDAIDKERNTIKEYKVMIDDLERAEEAREIAQSNINIEIDDGDKE